MNSGKGEFQICPHMDFDNILYVEYLRYNNYKMKLFYSSKVVRPQGDTLMYTLFVLICYLLNISLKSLTLLTATLFEWNMKDDSQGYTWIPLMCMNTLDNFFSDPSKFVLSPYWTLKLVSIWDSVLIFTMFQFLSTHNIFRKVGQIHLLYACKFS